MGKSPAKKFIANKKKLAPTIHIEFDPLKKMNKKNGPQLTTIGIHPTSYILHKLPFYCMIREEEKKLQIGITTKSPNYPHIGNMF